MLPWDAYHLCAQRFGDGGFGEAGDEGLEDAGVALVVVGAAGFGAVGLDQQVFVGGFGFARRRRWCSRVLLFRRSGRRPGRSSGIRLPSPGGRAGGR